MLESTVLSWMVGLDMLEFAVFHWFLGLICLRLKCIFILVWKYHEHRSLKLL